MNKKKLIISGSSPSRSDTTTFTFPPLPLTTFLRTNFSRSRTTRSKSRKRRRQLTTGLQSPQADEPSSPKVTCIGQVRLSKTTTSRRRFNVSKSSVLCCRWVVRVRGVMLCFSNYCLKLTCRFLRKWVSCGAQSHHQDINIEQKRRSPGAGDVKLKSRSEVHPPFAAALPVAVPMNAFVLTRCRSASSSVESTRRLWGSPTVSKPKTETEDQVNKEGTVHVREQRDSTPESRRDRESLKLDENRGTVIRLTRCKSEPGRVMEILVSDPEFECRRRRKSEFDCVN